jgi:hypothetical protein
MMRIAALAAIGLAACGPLARGSGEADDERLRLCVQNATVGYGNIVARAGITRFNVMPGQEQCRPVSVTGIALELQATTTGGGSLGPLSYAERLQPGGAPCWRWRLTNARSSSVDLTPCADP